MALIDLIAGQQRNVTNVFDQYRKGQVEQQQDVSFGQKTQMNEFRLGAAQRQMEQAQSDKEFQNRVAAERNVAKRRKMIEEGSITNPAKVSKMVKAYSLVKDEQFQQQGRDNDDILRLYDQYDGAQGKEKETAYNAMIARVRQSNPDFQAPATYQEAESSGWINQNIATLRESSEAWKRSFNERKLRSLEKYRSRKGSGGKKSLDPVEKARISRDQYPKGSKDWKRMDNRMTRLSRLSGQEMSAQKTYRQFLKKFITTDFGDLKTADKKARKATLKLHPKYKFPGDESRDSSLDPPKDPAKRKVGQKYIVNGKVLIWTQSGDKFGWTKE